MILYVANFRRVQRDVITLMKVKCCHVREAPRATTTKTFSVTGTVATVYLTFVSGFYFIQFLIRNNLPLVSRMSFSLDFM